MGQMNDFSFLLPFFFYKLFEIKSIITRKIIIVDELVFIFCIFTLLVVSNNL